MKQQEEILNYFYLAEFYIAPKVKHKKKANVKSHWTFGMVLNTIVTKTLCLVIQTSGSLIDIAFSNPNLTKNLLSVVLLAYMGMSINMLSLGQNSQLYAMALPILGKFVRWSGAFSWLSDVLSVRDTMMYISALNSSLESTLQTLVTLRQMTATVLEKYLKAPQSDEADETLLIELQEITNKFGGDYSTLEKYVIQNTKLGIVDQNEKGWVELENQSRLDLEEIKASMPTIKITNKRL